MIAFHIHSHNMAEVHSLLKRCLANGYVLCFTILRNLGLILSDEGALKNWKDVAGKLGYEGKEIRGYYENLRTTPGDPGLSVVQDWLSSKGTIAQLCRVFEELDLHSCLDELKKDMTGQCALPHNHIMFSFSYRYAEDYCRTFVPEFPFAQQLAAIQSNCTFNVI